jgi:hypothetical protein
MTKYQVLLGRIGSRRLWRSCQNHLASRDLLDISLVHSWNIDKSSMIFCELTFRVCIVESRSQRHNYVFEYLFEMIADFFRVK